MRFTPAGIALLLAIVLIAAGASRQVSAELPTGPRLEIASERDSIASGPDIVTSGPVIRGRVASGDSDAAKGSGAAVGSEPTFQFHDAASQSRDAASQSRDTAPSNSNCFNPEVLVQPKAMFEGPSAQQAHPSEMLSDVWVVSSRHIMPTPCEDSTQRLQYWREDADGGWLESTSGDFFSTIDASRPLIVFAHGNRTSAARAIQNGRLFLHELGIDDDPGSYRFVIWSWPSDEIPGRLRDLRTKAERSDVHGYLLARLLDRIDPDVPVSLVGYSFGARLVGATLHIMGGGSLGPWQLDGHRQPDSRRLRAVLMAAAMDNDWLIPGRRMGQALSQLERMVVLKNEADPALKLYPLLYPGPGPKAMGLTGAVASHRMGAWKQKIEHFNIRPLVGKTHAMKDYFSVGPMMSLLSPFVMFDCTGPTPGCRQDPQPMASAG
jgi:hypothetical protein